MFQETFDDVLCALLEKCRASVGNHTVVSFAGVGILRVFILVVLQVGLGSNWLYNKLTLLLDKHDL